MKKSKFLFVILTFAVLLSFSACKNNDSESMVPASKMKVSSSSPESKEESSSVASEEPNSTAERVKRNESQQGPVIDIQTGNEGFDEYFKSNPIDKKYVIDSNKAFSSVEMVDVSNKYAKIWEDEITFAYNKLIKNADSKNIDKYKSEQQNWINEKDSAVEKIIADSQSLGGTMAQVDSASKIMEYYRKRAVKIYSELYTFDKNYTYKFK